MFPWSLCADCPKYGRTRGLSTAHCLSDLFLHGGFSMWKFFSLAWGPRSSSDPALGSDSLRRLPCKFQVQDNMETTGSGQLLGGESSPA